MNWTLIVISALAVLIAFKCIKTIGKVVFFIILAVAVCVFLMGTFNINPLEIIGGYLNVV